MLTKRHVPLMHSPTLNIYLSWGKHWLKNTIFIYSGSLLDGAEIEVTLAKPVDKENYPKNPRLQRQVTAVPTFGFLPVDYSLLPALYSGYFPSSAKYVNNNCDII